MNQRYLLLSVASLIWMLPAHAQKAKVLSAYKHHEVYMSGKKCVELEGARDAINMAINDIQTAQWAKTWYYRGNIYFDIAISEDDKCKKLSDTALSIAYASYIKSLDLDVKKHYTADIHTRLAVIGPYFLNYGVSHYNQGEYKKALSCFQKSTVVAGVFNKTDSLGLYNAALSAEQLKDYEGARKYYTELTKVSYGGAKIYSFLANTYLIEGNAEGRISAILNGRKKYPDNENLIIEELNFYIEQEQYENALSVLEIVINNDPLNYLMYYYRGAVYDNLKEYDKAADSYRSSIELKPEYFDSNYNMGVLYFNQGVELNEEAFNGEGNEKLKESARKKFKLALPYLKKANEINSYDRPTLISLQKIYSILGDDEGYQRVTEELEN